MLKAQIHVMLKQGIFDPQGQAVRNGLESVGFAGVKQVRIGKVIELSLEMSDRDEADKAVNEMCDQMLANPVVESYSYDILEA